MKKIKLAALVVVVLAISQYTLGQKPSAADTKELEAAEAQMFAKIGPHDPAYIKDFVTQDYFSIDADGATEDKDRLLADVGGDKAKMMGAVTVKLFDKQIRAYGNVGIITGRAQAYMKDSGTYVVEFLYTAVFVKQNDKWMFTLWQGTISKDSPPPPPLPKS
jgi:hypothetical protein